MSSPLLKVSDLKVEYRMRRPLTALDNVSLTIPFESYTLGVVGESGSGKSTLGSSIMNTIEPPGQIVRGSIEYMGRQVLDMSEKELCRYRWQEISMIYQSAMNALNPVKPIIDPIIEVIRLHMGLSKAEARERATKLLKEVGIEYERNHNYPQEFSGGMRQRVIIALALALTPKILIADEPTSALDVVVQKQILSILKKAVTERGLSLIFITHEVSLLNGLVDNIAVIYAGEIVEFGPLNKVLFEPLHPYTQFLLSSLLGFGAINAEELPPLPVEALNDSAIPTYGACKFSSRCRYAFDKCHKQAPVLDEIESGRSVACHKYS
jgi:oligopeptide/dipeptide ABC transporter ATP-binding protein